MRKVSLPEGRAVRCVPAGRQAVDALIRGDHRLVAAPAAAGLGVGTDRVVGQLQSRDGITSGEQLEAAVVPAVRGIGIAQQRGDLLDDSTFRPIRFSNDRPVHRFPPDDAPRQAVGHRQLPVQAVGPGHQLEPREGEAITPTQGLLAVALAGPAVFGGEHQHQGGAVAEDQQVSSGEEDTQVRASAIHVGEQRAQAGRKTDPAAPAEHSGIGAQGFAEEPRGASGIEALAVGRVRFPFTLGEVMLLAAAPVRSGEKGPAVGGDLQGGPQGRQSGVLGPGGIGASSW